jgi:hypothetical protein
MDKFLSIIWDLLQSEKMLKKRMKCMMLSKREEVRGHTQIL